MLTAQSSIFLIPKVFSYYLNLQLKILSNILLRRIFLSYV